MTDTPEQTAEKIAARGREALISRLRPAFEEAAAAHSDVLKLGPEQIEAMVQRAADRADGLQWRRALAHVATEELGISLGEALSHPAVTRAHEIVGAPSYEDSLAELGPIGTRPSTLSSTPVAPAPTPLAEAPAEVEPEPVAKTDEAEIAPEVAAEPESEADHGDESASEPEAAQHEDEAEDAPAADHGAGADDSGEAEPGPGEDEPLPGWDDASDEAEEHTEDAEDADHDADAEEHEHEDEDEEHAEHEDHEDPPISGPPWSSGENEDEPSPAIAADLADAGFASDAELPATGGDTQVFGAAEAAAEAPAPVAAPGGATAEYAFEDFDEDFYDDGLRISVIHLGGIANLEPAEGNIELLMSADGLDIIRGGNDVLGRLEWDQVKALEVPLPRGRRRMRRPNPTHLVIRTARGDASFEVPDVTPAELRQHLAPVIDDHVRRA